MAVGTSNTIKNQIITAIEFVNLQANNQCIHCLMWMRKNTILLIYPYTISLIHKR